MKTRSFFFTLLFAATVFAFLTSCSGDQKENTTESHENHAHEDGGASASSEIAATSKPQFDVDEKFQEQLAAVFSVYIELNEALVSGDSKKAQEVAVKAKDALAGVDMKLLTGAAHNDWMNYLSSMENALKEIQSAEDLEAQRKSFSTLSDNLYKSVKAFGMGDRQAYYAYCPMAFNDEGAYWLSDNEKIRNPYFGEKMLTCGQVKEKLM